jgi:hypothetical protein
VEEFELQLFDLEERLDAIPDRFSPEYESLYEKIVAFDLYFSPLRREFYENMYAITYLAFMSLFFAFQHIPELVYTSITRRVFPAYSFKNIIDFFIFIFYFTFIIVSYSQNLNGSWKEKAYIAE